MLDAILSFLSGQDFSTIQALIVITVKQFVGGETSVTAGLGNALAVKEVMKSLRNQLGKIAKT